MLTGTVRWFNDAKGHGFITPDDGTEDLFVHFSQIIQPGFKTLVEKQKVTYTVAAGPKGNMAVNIYPDALPLPAPTDAEVDAALDVIRRALRRHK